MPLLPGLTKTVDTEDWTEAQVWTYALSTYLLMAAFLAGLILAGRNLAEFVRAEPRAR